MPCPDVFVQDAPQFLARKGLTFGGYLDPDREAIVADDYAARVNYETYLFADEINRDVFMADVIRYCGLVTDPITNERFRPHDTSPRFDYDGVLYLFSSEDSLASFVSDPETYRLPGYVMPKPPEAPQEEQSAE